MRIIAILIDEVHPLIELIEQCLKRNPGVDCRRVYWRDIVYSMSELGELHARPLDGVSAVYLDRLGEEERSYATQLILLDHWACAHGVPILNSPRPYLAARDKALSGWLLTSSGVATPPTAVAFSNSALTALTKNGPCAVKSTQGVCAEEIVVGVALSATEIAPVLARDGAAVVQPFISNPDRFIWRIDVVAGRIVMMNRRYSYNDEPLPICNGNRGGKVQFSNLTSAGDTSVGRLAIRATRNLRLDVAGVDIVVDEAGKEYVLEVNPEPDATYENGALRTELPFAIAELLLTKSALNRHCSNVTIQSHQAEGFKEC